MQPQEQTPPVVESELAGQPFGQVWNETAMTPGARRIIQHGRELAAADEAKRIAKNAKAKAARATKKAAALAVLPVVEPVVVEPDWAEATPLPPPPPLPPVVQHGAYRFQTATGRLKYGNIEITDDVLAAGLTLTVQGLHRLPASPTVQRIEGKFHLTPRALEAFKRAL